MRRIGWISALLVVLGCRERQQSAWVVVLVDPDDPIALDALEVEPASALVERRRAERHVALKIAARTGTIVVRAPGACPLTLDARQLTPGTRLERQLVGWFDLGPRLRTVGFDEPFELRATPRCAEGEAARIELTPLDTAFLTTAETREDGRVLRARTRPPAALARPSFGIVAVSAARREVTRIRARVALPGGAGLERELEVAAGTRASGLPNVAVDHAVLLAGSGLTLRARPEGSTASLRPRGDLTELLPDRTGVYRLADPSGHALELNAGRYDETPLDCGRGDCHAAATQGSTASPMTSALAADLGARHRLEDPGCALACHATGEPGRHDGGFTDVLSTLGGRALLPDTYDALPRALRRLGGVGCLACHGPGAIPAASARWAVLASDVCAVCHDAPPRYGHVAALASTRMAHADHDARQRDDIACARCHTTWGALAHPERKPPPEARASGLGCVTCHDVHPRLATADAGAVPALLRNTPTPSALGQPSAAMRGPSRVCLDCHAPDGEHPSASAAAIWAGRGGVDPDTGEALSASAPHATETRGCVGCHDGGPDTLVLGKNHAFRARESHCTRCHERPPPRSGILAARARSLFQRLRAPTSKQLVEGPPHASESAAPLSSPRQRALYDALLVLEDPAADVHNPAYAALLLERAERTLSGTSRGHAP